MIGYFLQMNARNINLFTRFFQQDGVAAHTRRKNNSNADNFTKQIDI